MLQTKYKFNVTHNNYYLILYCAIYGDVETMKLLIQSGCDIYVKGNILKSLELKEDLDNFSHIIQFKRNGRVFIRDWN